MIERVALLGTTKILRRVYLYEGTGEGTHETFINLFLIAFMDYGRDEQHPQV